MNIQLVSHVFGGKHSTEAKPLRHTWKPYSSRKHLFIEFYFWEARLQFDEEITGKSICLLLVFHFIFVFVITTEQQMLQQMKLLNLWVHNKYTALMNPWPALLSKTCQTPPSGTEMWLVMPFDLISPFHSMSKSSLIRLLLAETLLPCDFRAIYHLPSCTLSLLYSQLTDPVSSHMLSHSHWRQRSQF